MWTRVLCAVCGKIAAAETAVAELAIGTVHQSEGLLRVPDFGLIIELSRPDQASLYSAVRSVSDIGGLELDVQQTPSSTGTRSVAQ